MISGETTSWRAEARRPAKFTVCSMCFAIVGKGEWKPVPHLYAFNELLNTILQLRKPTLSSALQQQEVHRPQPRAASQKPWRIGVPASIVLIRSRVNCAVPVVNKSANVWNTNDSWLTAQKAMSQRQLIEALKHLHSTFGRGFIQPRISQVLRARKYSWIYFHLQPCKWTRQNYWQGLLHTGYDQG